jgi:hypothetical protein
MAKFIDYPRSSLKNALEMAKCLSGIGGNSKIPTLAEAMGLKVSGAFAAQIGGAVKYGLLTTSKGAISITQMYKDYKLAYTTADAEAVLRRAFLNVPTFKNVYDKFVGTKLPIDILDKLLVKEFGVEENIASRVAGYLVDAARMSKMLGDGDTLLGGAETPEEPASEAEQDRKQVVQSDKASHKEDAEVVTPILTGYTIHIRGPGMDSKITVKDDDDLLIVQATLNKVKKKLGEANQAPPNTVE